LHIGHALLGDSTYGYSNVAAHESWPVHRVMLHAEQIRLEHPVTGAPLEIHAPIPPDFPALEAWLREQFGSQPVVKIH
jgi:23S rRNA-/tRNA-specific pseudouridylate synthase